LIDEQLIFSEIDIQKLMNDRRKNTSFMELWRDNVREFRKVKFEIEEFEAENITRYVPPHPFVPSDGSSRDRRCSEIFCNSDLRFGKENQAYWAETGCYRHIGRP